MFRVNFDISKVNKLCDNIKKQLKSVKGARAGYLTNAEYPESEDGLTTSQPLKVWQNALIQEFGANITVTPKMRAYLRSQGLPLKRTTTEIHIPPRPFLRKSLDRQDEWVKFVNENFDINGEGMDLKMVAGKVGELMKNAIKDSIDSNIEPANSPFTLKQKAPATKTLKNTGLLSRSVQSEVIKNDRN